MPWRMSAKNSSGFIELQLEQRIDRPRIFLDVLGEPARDELAGGRQFTLRRQCDERAWIGLRDGDQSIPNQQWQIVVGCVFTPRHQRRSQIRALRRRADVAAPRPVQAAPDRSCPFWRDGRIPRVSKLSLESASSSAAGRRAHRGIQRPGVSQQTNRPDSNVFVGVPKLRVEKDFVRRADCIQRPECAQFHNRLGLAFKQLAAVDPSRGLVPRSARGRRVRGVPDG